jgi:hypothetical protein
VLFNDCRNVFRRNHLQIQQRFRAQFQRLRPVLNAILQRDGRIIYPFFEHFYSRFNAKMSKLYSTPSFLTAISDHKDSATNA